MPNNEADLNGFFDPSDRDGYFTYKIWKKMEDKFGTAVFSGLTGKTFLAVNYAFFDEFTGTRFCRFLVISAPSKV